MRRFLLLLALLLPLGFAGAACDNPLDQDPLIRVDSTLTVAAPTSELDIPSAIDIAGGFLRRPELSGDALNWDLALRQQGGQLFLRPFEGQVGLRGAGIFRSNEGYDAIEDAPTNRSAYQEEPIALDSGAVYVARSRLTTLGCVAYAKLLVLNVRPDSGIARFRMTSNFGCNDERLED